MKRTLLTLAALTLLTAAAFVAPGSMGIQTPPLPGEVQVTNRLVQTSEGCSGSIRVHYRAETVDYSLSFTTAALSNCTATISVAESDSTFSYLGGAALRHIFWEHPYGEDPWKEAKEHHLTAAWTGANPNYPCPSQVTWHAFVPGKVHSTPWAPPGVGWANATSDGGCRTYGNTTWTPEGSSPLYESRTFMSTAGDFACEAKVLAHETLRGAKIYFDDKCEIAANEVFDINGVYHLLAYIEIDQVLTIRARG